MSDLLTNLNSIYNTKLQIKGVLNTDNDTFSDYPQLIEEAIQGGGSVSGTTYITTNGEYNVSTYAYADVNVPVPPGYIIPTGTLYISENGEGINVSNYESVDVSVPQEGVTWQEVEEAGYIIPYGTTYAVAAGATYCPTSEFVYITWPVPEGTYTVTENGTYNVTGYENVYVNVSGGGTVVGYSLSAISQSNYTGMEQAQSFTDNGTYFSYTWNISSNTGFSPYMGSDTLMFNGTSATIESDSTAWNAPINSISGIGGNGTYTSTSNINYNAMGSMVPSGVSFADFHDSSYIGDFGWTGDIQITAKVDKALGWNGSNIEYECVVSNYSSFAPVVSAVYYSTDSGMTWNSMSFDSMSNTYSANLGNVMMMMSQSCRIKYTTNRGDYYVVPTDHMNSLYINTPNMSNMKEMGMTLDSMMADLYFYNQTANDVELTISLNPSTNYLNYVGAADTNYYFLSKYDRGTGDRGSSIQFSTYNGNVLRTSAMDGSWTNIYKYGVDVWTDPMQVGMTAPTETYRATTSTSGTELEFAEGSVNAVTLSTDGVNFLVPSTFVGKYIYFNKSTHEIWYEDIPVIYVEDTSGNTLTSFSAGVESNEVIVSTATPIRVRMGANTYYSSMAQTVTPISEYFNYNSYFVHTTYADAITLNPGVYKFSGDISTDISINLGIYSKLNIPTIRLYGYNYDSAMGTFVFAESQNMTYNSTQGVYELTIPGMPAMDFSYVKITKTIGGTTTYFGAEYPSTAEAPMYYDLSLGNAITLTGYNDPYYIRINGGIVYPIKYTFDESMNILTIQTPTQNIYLRGYSGDAYMPMQSESFLMNYDDATGKYVHTQQTMPAGTITYLTVYNDSTMTEYRCYGNSMEGNITYTHLQTDYVSGDSLTLSSMNSGYIIPQPSFYPAEYTFDPTTYTLTAYSYSAPEPMP